MSIQVEGNIQHQNIGVGTWSLISTSETYELYEPPDTLQIEGLQVRVTGHIRKDVMTLAMIGPVLEVQSYQILDAPNR